MSDPVFLRNSISSTIYAEQINSAQIQGQAAARERANRIREERLKDEQAMIVGLEESAKVDIREREGQHHDADYAFQEQKHAAEDREEDTETEEFEGVRHIDLTV